MSKTVAVADADFGALIEEIKSTHEEVVITENDEPIARIVPVPRKPLTLEELRKTVLFVGNVEDPILEWDEDRW